MGLAVASVRTHLDRLERLVGSGARQVGSDAHAVLGATSTAATAGAAWLPGWLKPGRAEERWPVASAILVAIALQVFLPDRLTIGPRWILPALEGAVAIGLTAANPRRIDRRSVALRAASVALIAVTSLANGWSSYELIRGIIEGHTGKSAGPLLSSGVSIYLTNIIVFALWYWEWDRGGPVARAMAERQYPDFLFPQMTQEGLAADGWRPVFVDYLYVSYTNATAFSPTDVMPLARWAKLLMLAQSAIALSTVGLVVARAVNILP
ncbi:MAG: hypothetical protein M3Y36_06650 [Actinomycetota bacterium]|nr:hypothetical protein [Actinomycetota bacterium]